MSNEKFTKDEWSIIHDTSESSNIVIVGGAELHSAFYDNEQYRQNMHDAQLIAQAPAMYYKLKGLSELFLISDVSEVIEKLINSENDIKQLLAKARGE